MREFKDDGNTVVIHLTYQQLKHIRAGLFLVIGTLAANFLTKSRGNFLQELIADIESHMRYLQNEEPSNDT